MPHKANAALRQRGSLMVWVREEAIEQWKAAPRRTPGGQASYSDLAITTALMLRAVFRLALRQTEGLLRSGAPGTPCTSAWTPGRAGSLPSR